MSLFAMSDVYQSPICRPTSSDLLLLGLVALHLKKQCILPDPSQKSSYENPDPKRWMRGPRGARGRQSIRYSVEEDQNTLYC